MRKIFGSSWMRLAFVAASALGTILLASPAHAEVDFRLRADRPGAGSGGATPDFGFVVTDSFPAAGGGDLSAADGKISTLDTDLGGGFTLEVSKALSKPVLPTTPGLIAEMDLVALTVKSGSTGGTVRLMFEDRTFTNGPDGLLALNSSIGGTVSGSITSITVETWVDTSNAVRSYGVDAYPAASIAALGATPGTATAGLSTTLLSPISPWGTGNSVGFTKAGNYSMFAMVTVLFGGAGTISFDLNMNVTPEPTSLALALAGIPAIGLVYRRKRRLPI